MPRLTVLKLSIQTGGQRYTATHLQALAALPALRELHYEPYAGADRVRRMEAGSLLEANTGVIFHLDLPQAGFPPSPMPTR